jgi:hypothetical protein
MRSLIVRIALLSGLCIAGCGASSPADNTLRCDVGAGTPTHTCRQYAGPGIATTCWIGTTVSSCPTADMLGTCTAIGSANGVTESESVTYYSDGGETAMDAQAACSATGSTWSSSSGM